MYLGYRMRLYDSIKYLYCLIGESPCFIYKGAAINILTEPIRDYCRTFRDIDIWITPEKLDDIKRSEFYDNGKIVLNRKIYGIAFKSVIDVKTTPFIENIIPVNMVLNNLKTIHLEDIDINVPTLEMQTIIMLAHEKKHKALGESRSNFFEDKNFLLRKISNDGKLREMAKILGLSSDLNNALMSIKNDEFFR